MQISYKKISWTVYILGWQKYASYIVCACIKMKTLVQALLTKRPLADLQLEITKLCSGFRMGLTTFYDNNTFSSSCGLYINTLIYFRNKDLEINMVLFIHLLFNFSWQIFFLLAVATNQSCALLNHNPLYKDCLQITLIISYYYMRNFWNMIGLEQWHFSLIWNTYMWKLQTFCGCSNKL